MKGMRGMRGLILCGASLLAGCAPITASMDLNPSEAARRALERQDYDRALEILRGAGPQEVDGALKTRVERLAAALEQALLLQAAGHLRRGEWAAALTVYQRGLEWFPDSHALKAARELAQAEHAARVRSLGIRLLLARGRYLVRLMAVYPQWQRLAPEDEAVQAAWTEARDEAVPVAWALERLGTRALMEEDPFLAVKSLTLAQSLDPDEATARRLEVARAAQARLSREKADRQQEEAAVRVRTRLRAFREALGSGDLIGARRHLGALQTAPPGAVELEALEAGLERAVKARIEVGLEAGRRHYLAGRLREALAVWRGVQRLRPGDPELASHVHRAERALESLRALEGASVPAEEAPGDAKAGDIGAQGRTQGGEEEHQQDS
ncbi:MAG: hypothetical protein ACLFTM_05920 [Ectothiorhodospira sp.]